MQEGEASYRELEARKIRAKECEKLDMEMIMQKELQVMFCLSS